MKLLNLDQPLGLPQGSVRAILALGIVSAAIFGQASWDAAVPVVAFYFVAKNKPGA